MSRGDRQEASLTSNFEDLKALVRQVAFDDDGNIPYDIFEDAKSRLVKLIELDASATVAGKGMGGACEDSANVAFGAGADACDETTVLIHVETAHGLLETLVGLKVRCLALDSIVEGIRETMDKSPLTEAMQEIRSMRVDKRGLMELKSFCMPPQLVVTVLNAVGALLENWTTPQDWQACKKLIQKVSTEDVLLKREAADISEQALTWCAMLCEQPGVTVAEVGRVSRAAQQLLGWVDKVVILCMLRRTPEMDRFTAAEVAVKKASAQIDKCTQDARVMLREAEALQAGRQALLVRGDGDAEENSTVDSLKTTLNNVKFQLSAAVGMPFAMSELKCRVRIAATSVMPPVVIELARGSGDISEVILSASDNLMEAKRAAASQVSVPALCQRWLYQDGELQDDTYILDLVESSHGAASVPIQVTLIVTLHKLWAVLRDPDDDTPQWQEAAEAFQKQAAAGDDALWQTIARFFRTIRTGCPRSHCAMVKHVVDILEKDSTGDFGCFELTNEAFNCFRQFFGNIGNASQHLTLMDICEQLARKGGCAKAIQLLELCLINGNEKVRLRAVVILSTIGDGQVVSTLFTHTHGPASRQAWQSLALCVSEELPMSQRPLLGSEQRFDVAEFGGLVLQALRQSRDDKTWSAAFVVARRLWPSGEEALLDVVRQRVRNGFGPAGGAIGQVAPRGHSDALKDWLLGWRSVGRGIAFDVARRTSWLRAFVNLGGEPAYIISESLVWLDDRHMERIAALELLSELIPTFDYREDDNELREQLRQLETIVQEIIEADWPTVRKLAAGVAQKLEALKSGAKAA
eukprot:TRINITY_DN75798_c0_g1_i1.p1 TRINITY_DN75798_c0_g1~~TRINITY_DN75798_c0_g1_i1.p1  ORF type:complete len:808 (+),score=147.99 TRINITY_DN75798_c0_g1_i1:48-2471(+)